MTLLFGFLTLVFGRIPFSDAKRDGCAPTP